jgi:F-type H+-transporting ATPase subunit a
MDYKVFTQGIPIFAKNLEKSMRINGLKSLLVAGFGIFLLVFSSAVMANEEAGEKKLDPAKIIMEHIQDSHEFHFFDIKNE